MNIGLCDSGFVDKHTPQNTTLLIQAFYPNALFTLKTLTKTKQPLKIVKEDGLVSYMQIL